MEKSTHVVEVVPVVMEKHPDADSLSVVKVWDYTVCVRTADWEGKTIGAYIPPDSVCPDTAEFQFLGKKVPIDPEHPELGFNQLPPTERERRIKAKRLRGVWSQGMLFPAPEGSKIGDNVAEILGITHYDPPEEPAGTNADTARPPRMKDSSFAPIYDVDSGYKYASSFVEGEEVIATEKIHGSNSRFVFSSLDGEFHMGTHYRWVKDDGENMWSKAASQNAWLKPWCEANPDVVVYAEVFGNQDLKYGLKPGEYGVAVFDLMKNGKYLSYDEARRLGITLVWAPVVYRGPFSVEKMKEICNGDSLMPGAKNIREGVVVAPVEERWDSRMQDRLKLKFVSPAYLERTK